MDGAPAEEEQVDLSSADAAPLSRVADLWEIGKHRLLMGDARDAAVYERLLQGVRAELIVTDPPYGCVIESNVSADGRVKHGNFVMGAGETSLDEFAKTLLPPAFKCMADHAKAGAIAFVFTVGAGRLTSTKPPRGLPRSEEPHHLGKDQRRTGCVYRSAHELI